MKNILLKLILIMKIMCLQNIKGEKMDKNSIGLPELTEGALEKLLNDNMFSLFLNDGSKNIIREEFKKFQEKGECSINFYVLKK